jgi:hypothetical protein
VVSSRSHTAGVEISNSNPNGMLLVTSVKSLLVSKAVNLDRRIITMVNHT